MKTVIWRDLGFRSAAQNCEAFHNLKVTGSYPASATTFISVTKRLHAALRGGFCVSRTRGSTVEAREKEIVRPTAQQKTMNLA